MLTTEQKLLSALCHLSVFISMFVIIPLIVLLVSSDDFVKQQAKEALSFQLSIVILFIIGGISIIVLIGIPIILLTAIATIVFPIIATVKIADGIDYSYPIVGNMVRKNF